jgi:glycosyltransferase involved in cell wall biosynthesis
MSCLAVSGAVNPHTGWGINLMHVARYLAWCEIFIRPIHYGGYGQIPTWLDALTGYDIPACESELIIYQPSVAPTDGKKTCYLTMHETDRLPPNWVRNLNQAYMVVCPSVWNAKMFRRCGVKTNLLTAPLGCSNNTLCPMDMNGPTIFGCAGRPQHGAERKGVNDVIVAFQRAFPKEKNVRLKLKTFPDETWKVPDDPRILVESRYFTEEEMTEWHASLTCFVSAARGEGWGLMQHHAMSTGRPVISVLYGGVTEYMKPESCYACDFDLVPAAYAGEGQWAKPRMEHIVDLMRYVHQSRDEARSRGERAHQAVHKLTWDNSCASLEKILKDYRFI